jgi:hypothetical protein
MTDGQKQDGRTGVLVDRAARDAAIELVGSVSIHDYEQ